MSYRFVKVTCFYDAALHDYYQRHPAIATADYASQFADLMGECLAWADVFKIHLGALGVEAHEIISNAEPLQRAWAASHGIVYENGAAFILRQLEFLKPEVIFFQDIYSYSTAFIDQLRQRVPSIRCLIGWCSAPYSTEEVRRFGKYDVVFSCNQGIRDNLRRVGVNAELMRHGFDMGWLARIAVQNKRNELSFTGSIIDRDGYHNNRLELVNRMLAESLPLRIYSDGPEAFARRVAMTGLYVAAHLGKRLGMAPLLAENFYFRRAIAWDKAPWPRWPSLAGWRLARALRPPVFGIGMLRQLGESTIGLNIHPEIAGNYASNVRLFEITGAGSCMLTDAKDDMAEMFVPDQEVVLYASVDEAIDKARWLLNHPAQAEAIGKAGQARVIKDHSYARRAAELNDWITHWLVHGK